MTNGVDREDLMRYLDGELAGHEVDRLESILSGSTELQRELAIFRAMKNDMQDLSFSIPQQSGIWTQVSRRLTRPLGWTLLVAGGLATCPALLVTVTWATPLLAVALAALRVR